MTNTLGLTTSQAAEHLGCSLSTVRRWADMGALRAIRTPGGQRRFPRGELDRFLASLAEDQQLTEVDEPERATAHISEAPRPSARILA